MGYREEVRDVLQKRRSLAEAIAACFHLPSREGDALLQAKVILDELFGYSVTQFLERYVPEQKLQQKVVTELLYGLYFSGLPFECECEFLLVQLLAEKGTIAAVLQDYSEEKTTALIAYMFKKPREGTFFACRWFDARYQPLIEGLLRQYYDVALVPFGIKRLEERVEEETYQVFTLLHELAPKTVAAVLDIAQNNDVSWLIKPLETFQPTLEEVSRFVRTFGLYGYPCIFKDAFYETTSLVEKLKTCLTFISGGTGAALEKTVEFQMVLSFILAIVGNFGERGGPVTCSIATCGRRLKEQAAIQSLLASGQEVNIVVFDQSEKQLFDENHAYITALNKNIVHISKDEAVARAKAKGVEQLIVTHPDGSFGYGGARNCQFLLTDAKPLYMVDDDMWIPSANIISASILSRHDMGCEGYQLGRGSKYNLFYWDLPEVLLAPEKTAMFPYWLDFETKAGLSEYLIWPRLCLNLPQGSEESHFFQHAKGHFFLKPSYHLAGSRYPEGQIPTSHFVGLAEHLERAVGYYFGLSIAYYLVSPQELPWNKSMCTSFDFIAQKSTQEALKIGFWQRVRDLFLHKAPRYAAFLQSIQALLLLDVESCSVPGALLEHEKASLSKLKAVYKKHQEDVRYFWDMGVALSTSVDPEKALTPPPACYPISTTFYLTAVSLGQAKFCDIISAIQTSYSLSKRIY